jgi:hypothetical protein
MGKDPTRTSSRILGKLAIKHAITHERWSRLLPLSE